ncbi:glycosyltransferase family 4 protein [Romeria aff. gracilis LEGE 07310]|uniref:Glycosyltransferase family 4 protein n=1 Tax=Vasconcelosia minhoensis LEGE 07310 TaxID=915328 RepID=A0A8J7DDR0_9CYAN|nr:glycosyltransferase family 4 protein [Romeria aff. gracilis LEGE 07310]
MNVAYVTHYDSQKLGGANTWSGLGYYIAQSLAMQGISVEYLGPLKTSIFDFTLLKVKQLFYRKSRGKLYEKDADLRILKSYSRQVSQKLCSSNSDIIFSATIRSIAFLESSKPIVFWADATCANLLDFYSQYKDLCEQSYKNWNMIEKMALEKCSLAIYSSDWAAQKAIDYYAADPSKVKVIPFGGNIDDVKSPIEIENLITIRSTSVCNLLFLGVDWYRKGGDIAFQVARQLNKKGLKTKLTTVGCQPDIEGELPDFIESLGFISKSTNAGRQKINQLFSESHFLILPSRAECFGVVFCEANSFAVPCIARKVGGVSTVINPGLNGQLFDFEADVSEYCDYIIKLFDDYESYKRLALSSYNEYQTRLNWSVSGKRVNRLLEKLLDK